MKVRDLIKELFCEDQDKGVCILLNDGAFYKKFNTEDRVYIDGVRAEPSVDHVKQFDDCVFLALDKVVK